MLLDRGQHQKINERRIALNVSSVSKPRPAILALRTAPLKDIGTIRATLVVTVATLQHVDTLIVIIAEFRRLS